jgi:pimeloyl-ACP methyl ester carboxylesterase
VTSHLPGARWLLRPAAALAAVGLASAAYQAAGEASDRRRYPPPGTIAGAAGRRLHFIDLGAGSPAVVLIPGIGGNALELLGLCRELSADLRAVACDRAGYGWAGPPARGRRGFDDMARELRGGLHAAGIRPPWVLAGHSAGGIIARRAAALYPAEVAGLVLIDSSHEEQARRLRGGGPWASPSAVNARAALRVATWNLGLRRLMSRAGAAAVNRPIAGDVPPDMVPAALAAGLTARHRRALVRELLLMTRSHGEPPGLGSLPLTVLSAAGQDPEWDAMQADLAALSTASTHVTAGHGGHDLHRDNPALVAGAIRDLAARARAAALAPAIPPR